MAVEVVHAREGRPGPAQGRPWLVAFGRFHGFGLAGALREVSLLNRALKPQRLIPIQSPLLWTSGRSKLPSGFRASANPSGDIGRQVGGADPDAVPAQPDVRQLASVDQGVDRGPAQAECLCRSTDRQ